MITVTVLTSRGVRKGKLDDVKRNSSFAIVDCLKPSPDELKEISKAIDIPVVELKESFAEDTRPRSLDIGNYFEITMKYTCMKKDAIKFKTISFFSSYKKNNLIMFHNEKVVPIEASLKADEQTLLFHLKDSKARFMFKFIGDLVRDAQVSLDSIEDKVDAIEKSVFRKADQKFLTDVSALKKILIVFQKEFIANREAMSNLHTAFNVTKSELTEIADIRSDISQIIDTIGTYRELVNGTMEVHLSMMSHNMNKIMKRLTGLGAVIVVPTLIASIYGMNFKFMPELTWKWGYFVTLGGMFIISLVMLWIFRKQDWI
jgi:magnesium transporter